MSGRERDFRVIEAWLEEGPDRAPDRLVVEVGAALGRIPQERRNPIARFSLLAAAVITLVVVVGGTGILATGTDRWVGGPPASATAVPPTARPTPCGPVEVANQVLAPAGSAADISEVILRPPYTAVMALRLSGAQEQLADLRIRSRPGWSEEWVTVEVSEPEPLSTRVSDEVFESDGVALTLHFLDDYVVTLTGDTSGCVSQFVVTTERDTVLREYDVENNRTSPPPAGVPRSPAATQNEEPAPSQRDGD